MKYTEIPLNEENGTYLDIYDSETLGALPGIVVIPGGGYKKLHNYDSEKVAISFLAQGFQAFVIRYAIGEHKNFDDATENVEQAMEYILNHATELKVDPTKLGIIGLSAGGQLAARYSSLPNNNLKFVILGYPVITNALDETMGLTTEDVSKYVNAATTPTFIFGSIADELTPYLDHIYPYEQALYENKIPFESHIFSTGGHGYSLANNYTGDENRRIDAHFARWFDLCIEWLNIYTK